LSKVLADKEILFDESLDLSDIPQIEQYIPTNLSVEDFDLALQRQWLMPEQYKQLDIAKYVLDLCTTEVELQRVGQELLLYQERDMFDLLRYLKFLVDTMRQHNIVWGVGRGSSVASYVLYLLGVHKINSIFYDLSIDEFLK
jgi:DNA polymerase III alpha subunit